MSLAIGIITKNGFVLAADSKMSSSHFSTDDIDKIIGLSDDIAVAIAGDGPLAFHIFDVMKKGSALKLDEGILSVAEQLHAVFSSAYDKYYPNIPNNNREPLELLLVGYTSDEVKVPHLYVLSSEDNFVPRQSPAGHNSIGTSHISNYILNRIYEKNKMANEQAAKLSVFCLRETSLQTKNVGGKFKIGTYSSKGRFELISDTIIGKMFTQCKNMQDLHKNKFYPEDSEGSDLK